MHRFGLMQIRSYSARGDRVVVHFQCEAKRNPSSSISVGFDFDEALDFVKWSRRNEVGEWHGTGKSITRTDDSFALRFRDRNAVLRLATAGEVTRLIGELKRHFDPDDYGSRVRDN